MKHARRILFAARAIRRFAVARVAVAKGQVEATKIDTKV
jgi:hypothetical protein